MGAASRISAHIAALFVLIVTICLLAAWHFEMPSPSPREEPEPVLFEPSSLVSGFSIILNRSSGYESRLRAIAGLARNLDEDDQQRLRELAKSADEHPTVMNDILSALERQNNKLGCLGGDLVEIFQSDEHSHMHKDYAIQHLEAVYDFSDNRSEIERLLLEVARGSAGEKHNFPGTAMLSLQRLGERHPNLAEEVKQIARESMISESNQAQEVQVTALQVAREAEDKSVLPKARQLALDESAITRLRMSAVGTIGGIGEREDVDLLTRLCEDKDKRVRRAAQYQLQEMKKKYDLQ